MLSQREQDVLNYIVDFVRDQGKAPLLTEIGEALGIQSKGVIHRYISALEEAGMIERSGRHRGIKVLDDGVGPGILPVLGSIAAGSPIEAIPDENTLDLNTLFAGKDCYVLKVKGESMIELGIFDGDWVVIEACNQARSGDVVVALVENEDVTLKTIEYLADQKIKLIPANATMEAMVYPAHQVQIQGLLKGQMRVY